MDWAEFEASLERLGLQKRQFAELMGVAPASLSRWRRGVPVPVQRYLREREKNVQLHEALMEIRATAACSEGVDFYVMLADEGLAKADRIGA
jgi:hypothetical protein